MVSSLAVVPDDLEPTNHLADGEEAETLGQHDGAGRHLRLAEPTDLLEHGSGALGGGLEEGGGLLDGFPGALEVGLEGDQGPARGFGSERHSQHIDSPGAALAAGGEASTYGGDIFWPWKTILDSSRPTLE